MYTSTETPTKEQALDFLRLEELVRIRLFGKLCNRYKDHTGKTNILAAQITNYLLGEDIEASLARAGSMGKEIGNMGYFIENGADYLIDTDRNTYQLVVATLSWRVLFSRLYPDVMKQGRYFHDTDNPERVFNKYRGNESDNKLSENFAFYDNAVEGSREREITT